MRRLALVILDGWGIAPPSSDNAIANAQTPNWDSLLETCPCGKLEAGGEQVGLPAGTMGNSEVGHITIGGGRVYQQPLSRIDALIAEGSYGDSQGLAHLNRLAGQSRGAVHLMTLVSDGGVHSHIDHLLATLKACYKQGVKDVRVHAVLDGRDTPPRSAEPFLARLEAALNDCGYAPVASIAGRYYTMDRDKRWERTQQAYDLYTGAGEGEFPGALDALEASYAQGLDDEFVIPAATRGFKPLQDGDTLFFANFRPDRARQIVRAFGETEFAEFGRERRPHLAGILTMTDYGIDTAGIDTDFQILLPPQQLSNTLGEVIAERGLKQLRLAETEKYAHVTYFFSGGREQEFSGEERILIPSPQVATYDLAPQMRAPDIAETLAEAMQKGDCALMIANFANGDMVGHTGNFEACLEACQSIDAALGQVREAAAESGVELLITADHGNVEQMRDDAGVRTAHSLNPVPLLYCGSQQVSLADGGLADIAPTALELMDIDQPEAMTGKSLIQR